MLRLILPLSWTGNAYDVISLLSLPHIPMCLNASLPSRLQESPCSHRRNGLSCPRYAESQKVAAVCPALYKLPNSRDRAWETVVWLTQGLGATQFLTCLLSLLGAGGKWSDLGIASYLQQHHEEQRQRTKA